MKGLCGGEIDPLNLFAFGDLDGEGRAARLQHPLGVAVGEQGIVYVADSYNHKLKKVEMEGAKARVVTMMEGLNEPGGVLLTQDQQKLYIADTNAHAIQVQHVVTCADNAVDLVQKFISSGSGPFQWTDGETEHQDGF